MGEPLIRSANSDWLTERPIPQDRQIACPIVILVFALGIAISAVGLPQASFPEGGIRTRPPRYMLESKPLERNPLFCNELRATILYLTHTLPTRFVTAEIGQYLGQSNQGCDCKTVFSLRRCPNPAGAGHHVIFGPWAKSNLTVLRWLINWGVIAWIGHQHWAGHWSAPGS
jgi:hypothetical protein